MEDIASIESLTFYSIEMPLDASVTEKLLTVIFHIVFKVILNWYFPILINILPIHHILALWMCLK